MVQASDICFLPIHPILTIPNSCGVRGCGRVSDDVDEVEFNRVLFRIAAGIQEGHEVCLLAGFVGAGDGVTAAVGTGGC